MLLNTVYECECRRSRGGRQSALPSKLRSPPRGGAWAQGPQGAVESPGGESQQGQHQERAWQCANDMTLSKVAGGGAQMVFKISSESLFEITEI